MNPAINVAISAARKAGRIINIASNDLDTIKIERKGLHDYVSSVDRQAEAEIISFIQNKYPHHGFLAEESGNTEPQNPKKKTHSSGKYQWIIDPLDGTTNFLHGFPQYAISIALYLNAKPQVAVIYDPNRNEVYSAAKGGGAYKDNRRIRVSNNSLSQGLIGTGFPFKNLEVIDIYLKQMELIMRNSSGLRRPGSAALDLAFIATGRLDGFWEYNLSPWDFASGILLIKEAGGQVTDINGNSATLKSNSLLCGNFKIHEQMLKLFNTASK